MMANAAGPIMAVYLLSMKLDKTEFVGTRVWYFFVMNLFKVPFSAGLGLITLESLKFNIFLIPVIFVGGVLGYLLVKYIPQKAFEIAVQVIAAAVVGGVSTLGGTGTMIGALLGAVLINLLQQSLLRWPVISNFWVGALLGILILVSVTIDAVIINRLRDIWARRDLEIQTAEDKIIVMEEDNRNA